MYKIGDRVTLLKTTFFGSHFIEEGTVGTVTDVEEFGIYVRFDNIDNVYGVAFEEVEKIEEVK